MAGRGASLFYFDGTLFLTVPAEFGFPPNEKGISYLSDMTFRLLESFLLFPKKLQQSTVNLLCVCPGYAVRPILYHQQAGSLDQLGGPESRCSDGQNPVRIAVNDQRGHVDATQVVTEVLMPCRHAGEAGRGRGADGDVPAD